MKKLLHGSIPMAKDHHGSRPTLRLPADDFTENALRMVDKGRSKTDQSAKQHHRGNDLWQKRS